MKITFKILLTPLLVILPGLSYGQGYISSDYMPASTLKDDAGINTGREIYLFYPAGILCRSLSDTMKKDK